MESTLQGLYNAERRPSWERYAGAHQFGGTPGKTVSEAFTELGLDYNVELGPLYMKHNGTDIEVPTRQVIYKDAGNGVPEILGTSGGSYRPLQNSQIAKLLDPLTQKWGLDTVAVTNAGRDLLIVLKLDEYEVNGDTMREYFWGLTSHDGLKSVRFLLTPVRLWCTNQLLTGLRAASFQANVSHTEQAGDELGFQLGAFQMLEQARRAQNSSFEAMGKTKLTREQVHGLLERIYPEPTMPKRVQVLHMLAAATVTADGSIDESFREHLDEDQLATTDQAHSTYEYKIELAHTLRKDAALLLEKFNDEHGSKGYADTGWAVYNAVVELADFRGPERYGESAARDSLTGDRAREKEHAFKNVMALADPTWRDTTGVVDGLTSNSGAIRQAREAARAAARDANRIKAEERAAARQARLVEEGKVKPRYAEDGVTILPPLTAEERMTERLERERAAIAALEAKLAERKAKAEAATKSAEQRIAERKAAAEARAAARGVASLERHDAVAASTGLEAPLPEGTANVDSDVLDLSDAEDITPQAPAPSNKRK